MILVTGHRGFIGKHVFEALEAPHIGLDIKDGVDLADYHALEKALKGKKITKVIHLAALAVAKECDKRPLDAFRSIYQTTFNLLTYFKNHSLERFVYISSSMVYGDFYKQGDTIIPAHELQFKQPKDLYGFLKLQCERLVKFSKLPYVIVRPSAVYGPGDKNNRVVQLFIQRAIDKKTIYLDGGGKGQLDFTYVDDLVDGLKLVLTHPKALNRIFNITRGEGRSLKELSDIIRYHFPKTKVESREADFKRPNRGQLNIERARGLGYDPKFSLEKGVYQYLKEEKWPRFLTQSLYPYS